MTKTIEIDESRRSLAQICFEIARDHFKQLDCDGTHPRIREQFARQAVEADELLMMFASADTITVATSDT